LSVDRREPFSTGLPGNWDYLFDVGAAALLAGFTGFLVLGLVYSSGLFNDLAAPFLLAAFALLYSGNRRADALVGVSSGPSHPTTTPPAA
jgi:hypothetical protein